jgi:hypothetical protein
MAGTIPLSMTQQFDVYGQPLAGGQLYIIQVGTVSTPQNAYQDTNLTIALPYPMTLDAAGRVPQFFLADGSVKIRLQDRNGVVQLASDSVLVIGASSGGGGGSSVDATQLISTGMMMFAHTTSAVTGFVRLNAKTIGSATSGATERANLDTQALFLYLWPDTTLTVSAGRGASAAADWAANKQLTLPDWRGYGLGALDDMGNTASGRISSLGAQATTLGGVGGAQTVALAAANLPGHTHGGSTATVHPGYPAGISHNHAVTGGVVGGASTFVNFQAGGGISAPQNAQTISISATNTDHAHLITTDTGSGLNSTAFNIISPRKLVTFFMKL